MAAATNTRNVRSFSSGDYIAGLMAELSKAAIAQRVAQARRQAGLTQEELADLLHVHTKTVQNWEAKTNPIVAYDRLDDVARATGVAWDWLLHGEREEAGVSVGSIESRLESLEEQVKESNALTLRALGLLELLAAPPVVAAPPTRKRASG